MKIVISPAKSLNFNKEIPSSNYSIPVFTKEAEIINHQLKELSPKALTQLMHISDKLAQLNWQRNQEFSLPFNTTNAKPAIYVFDGDVYEGIDVYSLSKKHIDKLQQNLRILSGQYGILKPMDLIQPYRLEMGTKIAIKDTSNLHDFWKDKITYLLNTELEKDEIFINLASNEYFKAIDTKKLKTNIITPIFKDWKSGQLKVISFYAKKARGLMVRFIVENEISCIDHLKGFDYQGYTYSEEHSTKEQLVFIR